MIEKLDLRRSPPDPFRRGEAGDVIAKVNPRGLCSLSSVILWPNEIPAFIAWLQDTFGEPQPQEGE